MQLLGIIQGKQVYYTQTTGEIPPQNHLALIVAGKFQSKAHAKALETVTGNDPLFVYCCCSNFTEMEDGVADLLCEKFPGFNDDTVMPMTFAGDDLEEALKFCGNDAFHEEKEIENIVIIDLRESPGGSEEIKALVGEI